jgi:hypothetical protein
VQKVDLLPISVDWKPEVNKANFILSLFRPPGAISSLCDTYGGGYCTPEGCNRV